MAAITLNTSTDPQVGYRPPGMLDIRTALSPYTGPFGDRQAAHLLRRAGFGGSTADIAQLAARGATGAVNYLLHPTASEVAFPDYPSDAVLYAPKIRDQHIGTQNWWLDRMLRTNHPLIEKMVLFWHGHFATSMQKVRAPLMARQINLFRSLGLGNFRDLLAAISIDPAMSIWLDNRANSKAHPNENYAREVMELFTLGLGSYTENDIREAARALTGWQYRAKTQSVTFVPALHDDGMKTFLGRTDNFELADIVNIIVAQPVHGRFLARKLLEFFVYSDPEPELTEAVAQTYVISGFDLARTVGTILRSEIFFSSRAYRSIPKSPIEFTVGLLRLGGVQTVPPNLVGALRRMGQTPLEPPNVKGWDGGPTWINTNTLLARFNFVNALMVTGGAGKVPAGATLSMFLTPEEVVTRAGGLDAQRVVDVVVDMTLQNDATSDIRSTLVAFLNSTTTGSAQSVEANAVPFGPENYQEKIRGALALALNLPVNQLN